MGRGVNRRQARSSLRSAIHREVPRGHRPANARLLGEMDVPVWRRARLSRRRSVKTYKRQLGLPRGSPRLAGLGTEPMEPGSNV